MSQAETSEDDLSRIYTLAERVGADVSMQLAFGKKFWLNIQMVKLLIYFSYFKKTKQDFKYLTWAISVALESNFTAQIYVSFLSKSTNPAESTDHWVERFGWHFSYLVSNSKDSAILWKCAMKIR